VAALVGVPPLALFTLSFSERLLELGHDVSVFFSLGGRERLKARLRAEGEKLSAEMEQLAGEYQPRLEPAVGAGR
jgi:hypothetical protein